MHLWGTHFRSKLEFFSLLWWESLFFKAALCHSWEWSVLLTQNTNGGLESGIVGRSQGAPIWPPVTSRSGMLIMEPVNANKMLPVLRSWEWMWDKNEPPSSSSLSLSPFPLPQSLSATLSLTLNYHYWALGTESSLLHLSDVGQWRALSHIQSTLPAPYIPHLCYQLTYRSS